MASVRLPVGCPVCGREEVQQFEVSSLAAALLKGTDITLRASCHEVSWRATPLQVEQIRQYLGVLPPHGL